MHSQAPWMLWGNKVVSHITQFAKYPCFLLHGTHRARTGLSRSHKDSKIGFPRANGVSLADSLLGRRALSPAFLRGCRKRKWRSEEGNGWERASVTENGGRNLGASFYAAQIHETVHRINESFRDLRESQR